MQTQKKDHFTCHLDGISDHGFEIPDIPHLGDTYVFDTGKSQQSPAIVKDKVIITKKLYEAYADFSGGYMIIENSLIDSVGFSVEASIEVNDIGEDEELPILYTKNDAGNSLYIYISKTTEGTALVTKLGCEAGDSIHGVNTIHDNDNFFDFSPYVGKRTHILISIGMINNNMSVKYTLNGSDAYYKVSSISRKYVNYKLATESYIGRGGEGDLESSKKFSGRIYHVTIWDTVDASFRSTLYEDRTTHNFKPINEIFTLKTLHPYYDYASGAGIFSYITNNTYVALLDDGKDPMHPNKIKEREFDYKFIVKFNHYNSQNAGNFVTAKDFVHPFNYSRSTVGMNFSSTDTQTTSNLNGGADIDLVIYTLDSNYNEYHESKKFIITHLIDFQFGKEKFTKWNSTSREYEVVESDNMELRFKFDNDLSDAPRMWAAINDTFLNDKWHLESTDNKEYPPITNEYWGFGIQLHTQHLPGYRSISLKNVKFENFSIQSSREEVLKFMTGIGNALQHPPNQEYHNNYVVHQSESQLYDHTTTELTSEHISSGNLKLGTMLISLTQQNNLSDGTYTNVHLTGSKAGRNALATVVVSSNRIASINVTTGGNEQYVEGEKLTIRFRTFDYNWPVVSHSEIPGTALIRGLTHQKEDEMFRNRTNESGFRLALLYDGFPQHWYPYNSNSDQNYVERATNDDHKLQLDYGAENVSHILWKANGKCILTSNFIYRMRYWYDNIARTDAVGELRIMIDRLFNPDPYEDDRFFELVTSATLTAHLSDKISQKEVEIIFFDGPIINTRFSFMEEPLWEGGNNEAAMATSYIEPRARTDSSYNVNTAYSFKKSDYIFYCGNPRYRWWQIGYPYEEKDQDGEVTGSFYGVHVFNILYICQHDNTYNLKNSAGVVTESDNYRHGRENYPDSYLELKEGKYLLLSSGDSTQPITHNTPVSYEIWMKYIEGDVIWSWLSHDPAEGSHHERTFMYLCKDDSGKMKFGYYRSMNPNDHDNPQTLQPLGGNGWNRESSVSSEVDLNSDDVKNNINQYVISYRTFGTPHWRIGAEMMFNVYFNGKRVIKDFLVSSNHRKYENEAVIQIGKQRSSSDAATKAHIYDIRTIWGYYTEENVKNSHNQGYDQGLKGYVPVSVQHKSETVNVNSATGLDRKYKIVLTGGLDYTDIYYYNGSEYKNPNADTILPGNTTIYVASSDGSSNPSGQVNFVAVEYEVDSTELSTFYEKGFHSYYTPEHNVKVNNEKIEDIYIHSYSDKKYTPVAKSDDGEYSLSEKTSYWLSLKEGANLTFKAA